MSASRSIPGTGWDERETRREKNHLRRQEQVWHTLEAETRSVQQFHSYLPCDASLQPVESTRTFVNAFACGARWCTATRTIICMRVYRRLLPRDDPLGDDLLWTHHVIVSRCNFACCCCYFVVLFPKDWNDCLPRVSFTRSMLSLDVFVPAEREGTSFSSILFGDAYASWFSCVSYIIYLICFFFSYTFFSNR